MRLLMLEGSARPFPFPKAVTSKYRLLTPVDLSQQKPLPLHLRLYIKYLALERSAHTFHLTVKFRKPSPCPI